MSESYDSNEFPVEVDLGKAPNEAGPMPAKAEKGKKYYPSLYISGIKGLSALGKEGWAKIYYKTRSVTHTTRDEKEDESAEIEVQKICLPETASEPDGDEESMEEGMTKLAKAKGVDTGHKEPDGDEEEEGEEEE